VTDLCTGDHHPGEFLRRGISATGHRGAENSFLRAVFILKDDQCTKTGSGQTWEISSRKRAGRCFSAGARRSGEEGSASSWRGPEKARRKRVQTGGCGASRTTVSGSARDLVSMPRTHTRMRFTHVSMPRAHRHPVTSASTNLAAIIMTRVSKPHAHVISCQRGISSACRTLTSACRVMLTS
jgi:hypothetical protein